MYSPKASDILVPETKFRELERNNSLQSICESSSCRTVMWLNAEYVVTGGMGDGAGRDWACFWGCEVKDLAIYDGKLKPLEYGDHWADQRAGNRERGYQGMLIKCGKRKLVVVGPEVTFRKLVGEGQLSIF